MTEHLRDLSLNTKTKRQIKWQKEYRISIMAIVKNVQANLVDFFLVKRWADCVISACEIL